MKLSTLAIKNARQSVNIILMIALASMLICTVVNLGFSLQQRMIDNTLQATGDYQVKYTNITEKQANEISSQSGILQARRLDAALEINTVFISQTLAEKFDYEQTLYLRFQKHVEPRSAALQLAVDSGLSANNVEINEQYLTANLNNPMVVLLVGVILMILCAAGALVIYNAYNLSVVKKIHQYGLLTVIGTSKKQVRRCVRLEALYCAAFGLPLVYCQERCWGLSVYLP